MKKYLGLVAVLILFSGCAQKNVGPPPPPPAEWKSEVVNYIKRSYFDPFSIRESTSTVPFFDSGAWKVCIQNNAKNRYGAYAGLKKIGLAFSRDGRIDSVDEDDRDCFGYRNSTHPQQPLPIN